MGISKDFASEFRRVPVGPKKSVVGGRWLVVEGLGLAWIPYRPMGWFWGAMLLFVCDYWISHIFVCTVLVLFLLFIFLMLIAVFTWYFLMVYHGTFELVFPGIF